MFICIMLLECSYNKIYIFGGGYFWGVVFLSEIKIENQGQCCYLNLYLSPCLYDFICNFLNFQICQEQSLKVVHNSNEGVLI